ncbi:MAG: hypothetical protein ABSB19_15585 [Methylomonas sp.]|jgi:hypothetical protein
MFKLRLNRFGLFWSLAIFLASVSNVYADSIDVFAGYNASSNNSYFIIQDNTAYNLSNLQFTVTGSSDPTTVDYGWNNQWSVANIAAGQQQQDYFNGTQGFQSDFPATYAYSGLAPSDLTYQLTGDLNGQSIQLSFSGGDGVNGPAFLGIDQYSNATNSTDFGQVASYSVAAVPLPGSVYLFASGFIAYRASRKKIINSC